MKRHVVHVVTAVVLMLAMVLTLGACGNKEVESTPGTNGDGGTGAKETVYAIKIGGTVPDDHPITQGLYKFEELVEKKSDGRLTIEVYPNNVLGNGRELVEAVQAGDLQMCEATCTVLSGFSDEYMSVCMPFIFPNREVAYAFCDGELGQKMATTVAEELGVRPIGYMENGIRQFTNNVKPVRTPADMKGLKVRVMESPIYIEMFTNMGANPMPMAFSELYTALQQGTVNGQDNPYAITCTNKYYEIQPYMTDLSHTFDITCFNINEKFYQELPADLRQIIDDAAVEACEYQRQYSIDMEEEYMTTIAEGGTEILHLSDEERAAFRETCLPMYEKFSSQYSPKVSLDEIVAEIERLKEEVK